MTQSFEPMPRSVLAFGPFRLLPEQRTLLRSDTPVRLGSRAREILFALVERAGEIVRKSELIARVWPGVLVEEGTLRVHIAALRKALSEDQLERQYIENINGHGYRFVARVERLSDPASPRGPLPGSATTLIGRGDIVTSVARRLRQRRLLTIVGPGGIGKTTVALAAMEQLRASYSDGVYFVDLATVTDPQHVPATVAAVLGLPAGDGDSTLHGLEKLAHAQMLIVLDNCEHVIESVAALAESILTNTCNVHILATSREPLRAHGERVLRLAPLAAPRVGFAPTAREAMTYPAIQLFVEHAMASQHTFELKDDDVAAVADICRRLDGLPLAIELAAAHVGLFGIRGLVAHLDDLLNLLTLGRRTALPRQQSLRATLEWSFNLLSSIEREALRRLSVFTDSFDLEAARSVIVDEDIVAADVLDIVSNLTAKSLIVANDGDQAGQFRLLMTARTYALEEARGQQRSS